MLPPSPAHRPHPWTPLWTLYPDRWQGFCPINPCGTWSRDPWQRLRPCSSNPFYFNFLSLLYLHIIPSPFNFSINWNIPFQDCASTSFSISFPSVFCNMILLLSALCDLYCPSLIFLSVLSFLPFMLLNHSAFPRPFLSAISALHESALDSIPHRTNLCIRMSTDIRYSATVVSLTTAVGIELLGFAVLKS